MRKFILITALVLASASAQAGERSLSMGSDTPAATAPVKAADTKTAEAPQIAETPKYVERPALAEPKTAAPVAKPTTAEASKSAAEKPVSSKADKPRHRRYWTEGRIISELHRHGVYW